MIELYPNGTDDTDAIQAALDQYGGQQEIRLAAGEFRISRTLTYHTIGISAGLHMRGANQQTTILRSFVPAAPLISISGLDPNITGRHQSDGSLAHFTCLPGVANCGDAFRIAGAWHYDLHNIHINKFDQPQSEPELPPIPYQFANGIHILGGNDFANNAHNEFRHLEIYNCAGWGILGELTLTPSGPSGISGLLVRACRFIRNAQGGARLPAFRLLVEHCVFIANGNIGLHLANGDLPGTGASRTSPRIITNEFDTNPIGVKINAGINVLIDGNRFNTQFLGATVPHTHTAIELGNETNDPLYTGVTTGLVTGNTVRNTPWDVSPYVFLRLKPKCLGVVVDEKTHYFGALPPANRYDDQGTGTIYR